MKLFDFINHINFKTMDLSNTDFKNYNKWMVDRYYSYFQDTVFTAQEISKYQNISKEQHFNFYYEMVPERKRYVKMFTKKKEDIITYIKDYYKVNNKIANLYLKVMPTDQIIELEKKYEE